MRQSATLTQIHLFLRSIFNFESAHGDSFQDPNPDNRVNYEAGSTRTGQTFNSAVSVTGS